MSNNPDEWIDLSFREGDIEFVLHTPHSEGGEVGIYVIIHDKMEPGDEIRIADPDDLLDLVLAYKRRHREAEDIRKKNIMLYSKI